MSSASPEPPEPVVDCTAVLQGVVREAHYMVKRDGVWTCVHCGTTRPPKPPTQPTEATA